MPTKTQINAALKSVGYQSIKMRTGTDGTKVYRDYNNKIVKGVRGGSIGPMTVTDAAITHNKETLERVCNALRDIGVSYDYTDNSGIAMHYIKGKKRVNIRLSASLFPAYYRSIYSPEYKNYYILVTEECTE